MSDSVFLRAAPFWLRGFLLTSLSAALTAAVVSVILDGAAYAVTAGSGPLSWLAPTILWCLFSMAAGTTVFCRFLLRTACILRGAAFGAVFALHADGRLLLAHPAAGIGASVLSLLFWLAVSAVSAIGSERLTAAYGAGDDAGFRDALRRGTCASLVFSGCALAASLLGRCAAGIMQ